MIEKDPFGYSSFSLRKNVLMVTWPLVQLSSPTSIGQSSTWNLKLIEQMGRAIAKEARAQGAHIGYGPVLDLARDPRWSRVEETYGEDPFLIGKMGEALVRGFQGDDFNLEKVFFLL